MRSAVSETYQGLRPCGGFRPTHLSTRGGSRFTIFCVAVTWLVRFVLYSILYRRETNVTGLAVLGQYAGRQATAHC